MRVCPDCNGFGFVGDDEEFCDYCDGEGRVGEEYAR
jgi:DnaJ-class molecular chaperone